MRLIPFLIASLCSAQSMMINAGGKAAAGFLADQGFTGGAAYGPASQADPGWKALTGVCATIRYGASFSYDYLLPNGSYSVKLDLIENRPAVSTLGVPAAAIGARVFTVAINGTVSAPIDIFAAAGSQTLYAPAPIIVSVTNNHLHIDFKSVLHPDGTPTGNATVCGIEVSGPVISLEQCTKPPVAPVTVTNPDGTTTTTKGSDCSTVYYVDVVTPTGAELKLIAQPTNLIPSTETFTSPNWTAVP